MLFAVARVLNMFLDLTVVRNVEIVSRDGAEGVILSLVVTVIALVVSVPAGVALASQRCAVRNVVLTVLVLPTLVLQLGVASNPMWFLDSFASAGTFGASVAIHLVFVVPYTSALICVAATRFDKGQVQQAQLLGANRLQSLRYIVIPKLKTAIVLASALSFFLSSIL